MTIYKYVSLDRMDILTNGEIRYTQPSDFNDPFEMPAYIAKLAEEEALEREFQRQYKEALEKHIKDKKEEHPFLDVFVEQLVPAFRKEFYEQIEKNLQSARRKITELGNSMGILSLTEEPDNLLMWSHYADHHKGMVIEFDKSHPVMNKRIHRVRYTHRRPNIKLLDLNIDDFLLTKSRDWSYEMEWRVIAFLGSAKRIVKNKPFDIHLFPMPIECIKRIILGARVEENKTNEISELLSSNERFRHIKIQRVLTNPKHFYLDFVDVQ